MAIKIRGSSGNPADITVIQQGIQYGKVTEKHECDNDGNHNIWSYNEPANKKDLEEDLENGGEKGWIREYILKYKNAIWTVTITGLLIWWYFGISSIVKYINNTRDQLVPVMSEWGGGENSSKISVSETLSENLETVRQATIQNLKKFLWSGDNVQKYPDLLEILRALSLGEDIKWNIQKLQNQEYSRLVGNWNTCYIKAWNNPS